MRYEIRPLGPWTGSVTEARARSARFRAHWDETLALLCREVEMLDGQLVVVRVDVRDGDLRRDGMLRTHAKVGFPGVMVSFESRHGPLTYATDAYDRWQGTDPPGWQANVRAIALALTALRAVDRYGVTRTGEQYRGWTAIGNGQTGMTVEQAVLLLAEGGSLPPAAVRAAPQTAWRAAAARHHPDRGGDPDVFDRLTKARDLLAGGSR